MSNSPAAAFLVCAPSARSGRQSNDSLFYRYTYIHTCIGSICEWLPRNGLTRNGLMPHLCRGLQGWVAGAQCLHQICTAVEAATTSSNSSCCCARTPWCAPVGDWWCFLAVCLTLTQLAGVPGHITDPAQGSPWQSHQSQVHSSCHLTSVPIHKTLSVLYEACSAAFSFSLCIIPANHPVMADHTVAVANAVKWLL